MMERRRRLPRGVLGHAGGGANGGRRPIYLPDDEISVRPQPSLVRVLWLERQDLDERPKANGQRQERRR